MIRSEGEESEKSVLQKTKKKTYMTFIFYTSQLTQQQFRYPIYSIISPPYHENGSGKKIKIRLKKKITLSL